jgi:CelD/BcsL family acetyltransferase involved in cellulose biosynthesis
MATVHAPDSRGRPLTPVPGEGPAGAAPGVRFGNLRVVVTDQLGHLEQYLPDWEDLASAAGESNIFYEPCLLLPAAQTLRAGEKLLFVLVFAGADDELALQNQLIGFVPLSKVNRFRQVPVGVVRPWRHPHCFLCTPLMRAGREAECWHALLRWLRLQRGIGLLELDWIGGDGPVYQALHAVLSQWNRPAIATDAFERALLQRGDDAEAYIQTTLSTGNRKELRRQRRRLGELGALRTLILQRGDDLEQWLDEFFQLEALGWKGQGGTALVQNDTNQRFFRAAARAAFAQDRLLMLQLRLDDRAIAMKCNFISGSGGFAFKIAYDEAFARFSPGVQLELDNIHAVHARPGLRWMDSCANGTHFMIDRLWRDRRTIRTLLVSTGRWTGNLVVRGLPAWRWLRQRIGATRRRECTPHAEREESPSRGA